MGLRFRAAVAAIVLAVAACGGDASTSSSVRTPESTATSQATSGSDAGPLRGFSVSPRGAEDFETFLDLVAEGGTLLEWVGDGLEWGPEAGSPEATVALAHSIGVEPITIGGWARTEDGSLLRLLTDENFAAYVDAAAAFAARQRPAYMGFGVEIDTNWREFPDQWERSTELFDAAADAIRSASPDTSVFVVFQLERLRGLQGGLFGGQNDESLSAWHLVDDFPAADLIAFTTYPGLVFETPADIPEDYYSSIFDYVAGPIAFSEMGWQAGDDMGIYTGTPQRQAEFVTRFSVLVAGLDVAFFTWAFLFDQPIGPPFGSMGLFGGDGEARPGWDAWLESD